MWILVRTPAWRPSGSQNYTVLGKLVFLNASDQQLTAFRGDLDLNDSGVVPTSSTRMKTAEAGASGAAAAAVGAPPAEAGAPVDAEDRQRQRAAAKEKEEEAALPDKVRREHIGQCDTNHYASRKIAGANRRTTRVLR